MPPDLSFERNYSGPVCGIDEAGRGPLAGPVVAAAVVLPEHPSELLLTKLDDSKKLSAPKRRLLFDALLAEARIGVGRAEVQEIDRINILQATFLAMNRAYRQLGVEVVCALVDGNQSPHLPCPVRTIVKGDALSLSIAAASIVAKVTRDAIMSELAEGFPGYGWESNAGYGTRAHMLALRHLGPTPHHRKSFAPIGDLFDRR